MIRYVLAVIALGGSGIMVPEAIGARIPGGGPAKSDCYSEFEVRDATPTGNKVVCMDGDPCDIDGACDGTCTFGVSLCLNQTDVAACVPAPLTRVRPNAKCGALAVPSDLASTACEASAALAVPTKKGGRQPGRCKIKVAATSSGRPKKDVDKLTLVCLPRVGECATSPCGNGVLDVGEQCDPDATPTGCEEPTPSCVACSCTGSCPGFSGLSFAVGLGSPACGAAGLKTGAQAPLSGQVDDAAGKIADLGLGCLYFGGGGNDVLVPGPFTNGFTVELDARCTGDQVLLTARGGTPQTCNKAPGPGRHCISGHNAGATCTSDAGCGSGSNPPVGVCALDANCYFGPAFPVPNPNKALNVCSMNVVSEDLAGTADVAAGAVDLALKFKPHLYLTGLSLGGDACPKCVDGHCRGGKNAGGACVAFGSTQTAAECPPNDEQFIGAFAIDFSPFSTGATSKSDPTGNFCPGQRAVGAFGQTGARGISESGSPVPGGLTTAGGLATLATVFCVPASGSDLFDPVASFPGPGAYSLTGTLKLLP